MFEFMRLGRLLLLLCLLPIASFSDESSMGGDFELTSQFNLPYSSIEARGKVVMLFFGFAHCPDVCPNTLGTIQTVLEQLGERSSLVQPIFISVDPKRDTPEILKNYLKYFGNDFIGLTGSIEEIDEVVKQFQGFYSFEGDVSTNQYVVDHTSNLYIINTVGEVTNIFPYGLPPEAITKAIVKLLDKIKA